MRRVRLRPTAFGAKTIAFWLVNLAAFLATAYSNLFFLLLAFLSLLLVASPAWTAWHLRRLRDVRVRIEEPAAPFGPSELALDLEVRGAFHGALLEVFLAGRRRHRVRLPMQLGSGAWRGALDGLGRGVHPVTRVRLTSAFPWGLWRGGVELALAGALVHPPSARVFATPRERTAFLAETGGEIASGHGEVPIGLRPHRDGDEPRRISWRASARRGQRVVLELAEERQEGLAIVLDRRAEGERFERALGEVVLLAETARREEVPVSLHTQGRALTCVPRSRAWRDLAHFLAELAPLPADQAGEAPRAGRHAVRFPRTEEAP